MGVQFGCWSKCRSSSLCANERWKQREERNGKKSATARRAQQQEGRNGKKGATARRAQRQEGRNGKKGAAAKNGAQRRAERRVSQR
jgi:hypothetical protein